MPTATPTPELCKLYLLSFLDMNCFNAFFEFFTKHVSLIENNISYRQPQQPRFLHHRPLQHLKLQRLL